MNKQAKIATIVSLMVVVSIIAISVYAAPKKCSNGIDDDGDGYTDWPSDPGCSSKTDNDEHSSSLICDNGIDETNDADSLADYKTSGGDPGCSSPTDSSEVDGACDDLSDNDGDTYTDYPSDSGCTSYSESSELGTVQCDDGTDNGDADSLSDYPNDPGCSSTTDNNEVDGACDDLSDNDGDTYTDYPSDSGCSSYSDSSELGTVECDDGTDNGDADSLSDYPNDPGCASTTDNDETDGQCDDTIDNDGDNYADLLDYSCSSYSTASESPLDYCADSDGPFAYNIAGTVSGWDNSVAFNYTDYCNTNSTGVIEHSCLGIWAGYNPNSAEVPCSAVGYTSCVNGACV